MRPTPQRVKEIKESIEMYLCNLVSHETASELLAEIDALRAENKRLLKINDGAEHFMLEYRAQRDALKSELDRTRIEKTDMRQHAEEWEGYCKRAEKERDNLKTMLDDLAKRTFPGEVDSGDALVKMREERDALRAECKRNTSVHFWNEAYMDLQKERDSLKAEVVRLNRVILQELTENDEIGAEYTYVRLLGAKNAELKARIEKLREALNIIGKSWARDHECAAQQRAREALAADEEGK